ncbi:MAG: hypothetical protein AAB420_03425 [Patescibacteria group bacterium]
MLPGLRAIKRFLIVFIALGIVLIAILYGGRLFQKPVISPTPDPLAGIQPIKILSTDLFRIADRDYDVLFRVQNPNQTYGSGDVQYKLVSEGAEIYEGSFYILPGQTKYMVISPVKSERIIEKVEMHIDSVDWRELDTLALEGVSFVVTNTSYGKTSQEGLFARLRGFVANNSDFDVNRADVAIILFDEKDRPLAINRTELYTFLAHTTRGFETSWFHTFPGEVARTYIEVNANLFEQASFIRTYGGQERFQTY